MEHKSKTKDNMFQISIHLSQTSHLRSDLLSERKETEVFPWFSNSFKLLNKLWRLKTCR